jgi:Kef-type K+ transport system membrane component KefB
VELEFANLLIVVAIAFLAPLTLGLAPGLRLPAVVFEIVLGIAAGPSGLGWVEVDEPVAVLSVVGLAFLLFLAGLEIDLHQLRGRALWVAAGGFALSFAIALAAGGALQAAGVIDDAVFVAIVLSATSLGIVIPILKDRGESASPFGQLVIAGATIADFATIILLSLLFSRDARSTTSTVLLLGSLAAAVVAVALVITGAERIRPLSATLARLQDTTAQIRVRGAFLLLVGLTALATELGLEIILGAFLAGAIVTLVDMDRAMTHPEFRRKLEAIGFGVFIPVFFVTSGVRYDLDALLDSSSALVAVPVFVVALLLVRGLPAVLYRSMIGAERVLPAALLQATSLPFIVAATAIGLELGVVDAAAAASLVAAGLLSVVLFPVLAVARLDAQAGTATPSDSAAMNLGAPLS